MAIEIAAITVMRRNLAGSFGLTIMVASKIVSHLVSQDREVILPTNH
jgi:hypothetical protein